MGKVFTGEMAQRYSDVTNKNKWDCKEFHTKVVGLTFVREKNPDLVESVQTGDFIVLKPEVNNKFDPNAVMVMHDTTGERIGYIAKELAPEIRENIIQKGDLYIGRIERTGGEDGKEIGMNLSIKRFTAK